MIDEATVVVVLHLIQVIIVAEATALIAEPVVLTTEGHREVARRILRLLAATHGATVNPAEAILRLALTTAVLAEALVATAADEVVVATAAGGVVVLLDPLDRVA